MSKHTEPLALVLRGGDPEKIVAHACGECRIVKASEQDARECHAVRLCDCGAEIEQKYYLACSFCRSVNRAKERRQKEAAAYLSAAKVSWRDWDGPVYCEGAGQEVFSDIDEFTDHFENEEEQLPVYVWATITRKLSIRAEDVVDIALDDHHDDAPEQVGDLEELQSSLDKWCESQTVETWFPDMSKVVLLDGLGAP